MFYKSYFKQLPIFLATTLVVTMLFGLFLGHFSFKYAGTVGDNIAAHVHEHTNNINKKPATPQYLCKVVHCKGIYHNGVFHDVGDGAEWTYDEARKTWTCPTAQKMNHMKTISKALFTDDDVSIRYDMTLLISVNLNDLDDPVYFKTDLEDSFVQFFVLYMFILVSINIFVGIIIRFVLIKERMVQDILITREKTALQLDNLLFFVENLNHEVNTPLFVLSRKMNYLKTRITNEGKTFEIVDNSLEQINAVIQRTRELKRINNISEDRTVHDLISSTILTIDVMRSENITNCICDTLNDFYLDQEVLTNGTFINLLTNHIKNSIEAYSDLITIKFIRVVDEKLVFTLSDNGNGVDEKIKKQIFGKGFSTKGDKLVRGSGLSINKFIIESVGGYIKLNDVEEGAQFEICIPVKINEETPN